MLFLGVLAGCQRFEKYEPNVTETEIFQSEEVFYCNGVDRYAADTLTLPEFEIEEADEERIVYKNVTALKMKAYCTKMEKNGFTVVRYDYITYFYSNTCWIRISHALDFKDGTASLSYCTRTSEIPENAITAEKAKQIIGELLRWHLLGRTEAEIDDQLVELYQFRPRPSFTSMLIFAREMIDVPNHFYVNYDCRRKPYLK
jgi:hypothetical protein